MGWLSDDTIYADSGVGVSIFLILIFEGEGLLLD